MNLTSREKMALQKLYEHRPAADTSDFYPENGLANVGPGTVSSLIDKGLIERGRSRRHHGAAGIRLTAAGEKATFT